MDGGYWLVHLPAQLPVSPSIMVACFAFGGEGIMEVMVAPGTIFSRVDTVSVGGLDVKLSAWSSISSSRWQTKSSTAMLGLF